MSFVLKYVVDAARVSLRTIFACSERSGALSRKTTAVMTFVMLAIDRRSCEFSSQSTSPVAGS